MKILLITYDIDKHSGWGRYSSSVFNELRKAGHEVEVLTEKELPKGAWFSNMRRARTAAKKVDIVHALDVWPYAVYGYAAVRGTKRKFFVSGIGTYSVLPLDSRLKRSVLKPALKRAGQIFCISAYVMREMTKRLPLKNISVVHMGSDRLPELTHEEKDAFARAYSIRADRRPVILTVGAVKERKGQFDTVQAVKKLLPSYPDLTYIMVGSADERAYVALIERYVKAEKMERHIFLVPDAQNDKALSFFYDICDVFVMNSNNAHGHLEGFGLVFLEAASFGKPVVGSSNCGIEDALEDGYNGYLARQGSHQDIADKIHEALENKEVLGEHSREFASRFSWAKTAEAYLKWYGQN